MTYEELKMQQFSISLCHATARIPDGWKLAAGVWVKSADKPQAIDYVLVTDDMIQFVDAGTWLHSLGIGGFVWAPNHGRRCAVDAWNESAKHARGKLIITVSDDWFPPDHWDTRLLECIPNLDGDYVLDVDNQDGSYPLLPFSILTTAYYKKLGYLFNPEYFGNMADVEFTEVARRDGVVIDARHLKFEHRDPSRGAPWDEIYERQRVVGRDKGLEIYERRKKEGFIRGEILV